MHAPRTPAADTAGPRLEASVAADLARRALANIAREYPNQPQYRLDSDADALPPRVVHPAFFGCFDWHSAVHTHWLLVRIVAALPDLPLRAEIEAALARSFAPDKLRIEADYLVRHPSFERPYGLAWLTLLAAEAKGTPWASALQPLAAAARSNTQRWLAALRYPVRSGTHNQTAFALTLLCDATSADEDGELQQAVHHRALALFAADADAALHFEPSGEDFLSPSLMEADLLRRVMPAQQFAQWLLQFLPHIPATASDHWLACAEVADETDGRAVHLHGLNLSRAWNLANLAAALPGPDPRRAALDAAAERHRRAGLAATLANRHYAGDHWLPSFAVYLLTERGRGEPGT
jgi:hypothetical protein